MLIELLKAVFFSAFVVFALFASNFLYDKTKNFVYSRKLAHSLVGVAVLSTLWLFDSPVVPLALSLVILAVFITTHTREVFYGVAKRGRLSEIYFASSCAVCFAAWYLVDPKIAVASTLFLAWGDGITGLVRWWTDKRHAKTLSGTAANLVACSLIALLVTPYWVGAVGVVVAVVLEHLCGDVGRVRWLDDNLAMPLGALIVMGGLTWVL